MQRAIFAVHGKSYTSQKSIGLYKTTGTASDWWAHMHDSHNIVTCTAKINWLV